MKPQTSALLLLAALISLTACSSDNEPDSIVKSDNGFLYSLAKGKQTISYQMYDYACFIQSYESDWTELDLSQIDGLNMPVAARVTFHKGLLLTPLSLFNISTGPHTLYLPFEAYKIASGFDSDIMVSRPLDYDASSGTLTFDGGVCSVTDASSRQITIERMESNSIGGYAESKWVMNYSSSDFLKGAVDMNNVYGSEGEACLGIIAMMRLQFGDSFDMNPYLAREGMRSADSIVDLNALEAEIRLRYDL